MPRKSGMSSTAKSFEPRVRWQSDAPSEQHTQSRTTAVAASEDAHNASGDAPSELHTQSRTTAVAAAYDAPPKEKRMSPGGELWTVDDF